MTKHKINMPTEADFERLRRMPETPIYISGPDMFCLLGIIQLALRHPYATETPSAQVARVFAEEIEKRIVEASPGMKDLCTAGWNPELDVPWKGRER